jgi:hypothetical protein
LQLAVEEDAACSTPYPAAAEAVPPNMAVPLPAFTLPLSLQDTAAAGTG